MMRKSAILITPNATREQNGCLSHCAPNSNNNYMYMGVCVCVRAEQLIHDYNANSIAAARPLWCVKASPTKHLCLLPPAQLLSRAISEFCCLRRRMWEERAEVKWEERIFNQYNKIYWAQNWCNKRFSLKIMKQASHFSHISKTKMLRNWSY